MMGNIPVPVVDENNYDFCEKGKLVWMKDEKNKLKDHPKSRLIRKLVDVEISKINICCGGCV